MTKIKCTKSGRAAVDGSPRLPQVKYSVGDVIDAHDKLAARLIEVGHAESYVEEVIEITKEYKKKSSRRRDSI